MKRLKRIRTDQRAGLRTGRNLRNLEGTGREDSFDMRNSSGFRSVGNDSQTSPVCSIPRSHRAQLSP
ncbi:hypothetical protein AAFF_G00264630 [Aldrovandia affinis]|uniref:Uncharacterized protein n=1 Tax=Aldrovandia affinis TaxID=143900 RepID=A0AAD7RC65_9TELE|nr:hypothetical protein AAFF_G00264630 [Aldrovandia affinis]